MKIQQKINLDPNKMKCGSVNDDAFERKVNQAIRLLKTYDKFCNLSLAYSGGKDSDVILHLCKLAHIKVDVVHNVTTIDPPGTIAHCERAGARIVRPDVTFFKLIEKKGLPTMFRRFCCQYLKEKYIAPQLVLGIRADESVKRKARYVEPSTCRIYTQIKRTEQVLPIIFWTDNDVSWFVRAENIKCHPLYYVNGEFDVSKRLGCLGCPLQSDRGKADFLQYPKFLRQWARSYKIYCDNHGRADECYYDIVRHIFYSNHGEAKLSQHFNGLFEPTPPKEILEDYFHVSL